MLIVAVFFALLLILLYIYGGLKFAEDIESPSGYALFWIAYILFGITITTIILLGNFWSVLVHKTGPPGPRGIPGDEGEVGMTGECDQGNNIYYAMRVIKMAIADEAVLQTATKTPALTVEQVYRADNNKLVNVFLDNTVNRMVTSKQFDILLELPVEELKKLPPGKRKTFAKSLEDLAGYLAATWREWLGGFFQTDYNETVAMLATPDKTPEDQPKLSEYLNNEIEKYDIWYWGTTRVFRPLKAEICRQNMINYGQDAAKNNIIRINTRFPSKLRPLLEIRRIKYSDTNLSNLDVTWDSNKIPDATPNFSAWRSKKDGVFGTISRPKAVFPKIIKDGNKIFYPIGAVIVESNPARFSNTEKETILVSGDVIMPDRLVRTWDDKKKKGAKSGNSDGDADGMFYQAQSSKPGYKCMGDYFESDDMSIENLNKKYNPQIRLPNRQLKNEYKGLVCLPDKCLIEVPRAENPVWAYQFNKGWDKRSYYQVDIFNAKNPAEAYNINRTTKESYRALPDKKFGHQPGDGKFYKIKPECLATEDLPVKQPEPEYTELGMGWFGHPYKTDRKYSIFAFLGLMPEGIIIHGHTAMRFYIRHYGGMEPNKFIVLNYDTQTDGFDRAFRAKSDTVIDNVAVNLTDERQQWRVDKLPNNSFRLAAVMYPNKFLALTTQFDPRVNYNKNDTNRDLSSLRPPGVTIDQTRIKAELVADTRGTREVSNANKCRFINLPAYGTDMDILDEPDAKPIDRRKSVKEQQNEERRNAGKNNFDYINKTNNKKQYTDADGLTYIGNRTMYMP